MSTPHNQANMGEIAKFVLMPGDPLRAKFIAESFLENPVQFNTVRNMFGYTGNYKGKKVSVMASGMGIPSIGIYSYELFKYYGVEKIVRIGSTGAYSKDTKLYETILVTGSFSHSTFAICQSNDHQKMQYPDPEFNDLLRKAAKSVNVTMTEAICYSSDVFYGEEGSEEYTNEARENGAICAEMESFGLFHTANALGKKAACLLTVSDNIETHEETTHEERRYALVNMMKVALEAAVLDE